MSLISLPVPSGITQAEVNTTRDTRNSTTFDDHVDVQIGLDVFCLKCELVWWIERESMQKQMLAELCLLRHFSTFLHRTKVSKSAPDSASWKSYFEHPSEFRSSLFANGASNKPLEPSAVSRVNAAVVNAADRKLAANLAALDQARVELMILKRFSNVAS